MKNKNTNNTNSTNEMLKRNTSEINKLLDPNLSRQDEYRIMNERSKRQDKWLKSFDR